MEITFLDQPIWPLPWFIIVYAIAMLIGIALQLPPLQFTGKPLGRHGWTQEWPLLHLFGFMLAAFVLPDHWFLLFWVGFLWEGYEYMVSALRGCKDEYWYFVGFDVIMNTIGIALGSTLRKLISTKGSERQGMVARLLVIVPLSLTLLFVNDQWRYVARTESVRQSCGCTHECDYDLERAPKKK
jgi:hypothetical protein